MMTRFVRRHVRICKSIWEFFTFFLYFHRENRVLLYTSNQFFCRNSPQSIKCQVTTGHDCQENVNLCESFSSSPRMSKFAAIINKWLVSAEMALARISIVVNVVFTGNEVNFNRWSSTTSVRDIITICYGDCKNYVFRKWLRHKELQQFFIFALLQIVRKWKADSRPVEWWWKNNNARIEQNGAARMQNTASEW